MLHKCISCELVKPNDLKFLIPSRVVKLMCWLFVDVCEKNPTSSLRNGLHHCWLVARDSSCWQNIRDNINVLRHKSWKIL